MQVKPCRISLVSVCDLVKGADSGLQQEAAEEAPPTNIVHYMIVPIPSNNSGISTVQTMWFISVYLASSVVCNFITF